jgi:DNA-binding NarL/FixJ family response regulator
MTTSKRSELVRVVLVDDHPLFREAVRLRLATAPRFQVVGEASSCEEALVQIRATRPHLVVIDISLCKQDDASGPLVARKPTDMSGLILARKVRALDPEIRVLICSASGGEDHVAAARAAGTRGYVVKSCRNEDIVRAIEVVVSGGCYYSAGLERVSVSRPELTAREMEVLQLVSHARSSAEIARELKMKCRTVENHRQHIMEKLDARNVVDMIRIAFRYGLIDFMS